MNSALPVVCLLNGSESVVLGFEFPSKDVLSDLTGVDIAIANDRST